MIRETIPLPGAFFLILSAICLEMINLEDEPEYVYSFASYLYSFIHYKVIGDAPLNCRCYLVTLSSTIAALEFVCCCILVEIVGYLNWQMCGSKQLESKRVCLFICP